VVAESAKLLSNLCAANGLVLTPKGAEVVFDPQQHASWVGGIIKPGVSCVIVSAGITKKINGQEVGLVKAKVSVKQDAPLNRR
jgi:hypothetical protein